jgi:hypothetical protein
MRQKSLATRNAFPEVSHENAADHHVVKVSHHEVRIGYVHIDTERCQEQSGESADQEQPNKAERIEHRRRV